MCGNEVVVLGSSLTTGHTKGCGHNVGRPSAHGDSGTRFYKIWSNLKERCLNTNSDLYKYYGARGTGISDEWLHSYERFKLDMYRGYLDACKSIGESDVTIDRKDSSLGYSKDNCQWLSRAENTSKARLERAGRVP